MKPSPPLPAPSARGDSPLDALWAVRAILWVLLAGLALSVVLTLAPADDSDRWSTFWRTCVLVQWLLLTTLSMMYGLNRWLARLRPINVAWVALGLLMANTWAVAAIVWLIFRPVSLAPQDSWHGFFLRATGIALAVGLLGLAAFQNHWRARQLAVRAKQAELEALQARIRPHFLFNTLNTGAALVHQRPEQAERLLLDLADLFRAALGGPREIPLADELALARRYLEIEALRFGERLRVAWDVPTPLPDATVPALSIQPLVENAIRHGIEPLAGGGTVSVQVHATVDEIVVTVRNPLPPAGRAGNGGHRVGLSSSRARIEALTGGRGRLEAGEDDGMYVASMTVPLTAGR